MARVAYLDSSALVKLVLEETESTALRRYLAEEATRVVSSVLAAIEVPRAVRRAEAADFPVADRRARRVVGETVLLELTLELAQEAATAGSTDLRSADAVHLVSAVSLGPQLSAFIAYDGRLCAAAAGVGLPIISPSEAPDPLGP